MFYELLSATDNQSPKKLGPIHRLSAEFSFEYFSIENVQQISREIDFRVNACKTLSRLGAAYSCHRGMNATCQCLSRHVEVKGPPYARERSFNHLTTTDRKFMSFRTGTGRNPITRVAGSTVYLIRSSTMHHACFYARTIGRFLRPDYKASPHKGIVGS